MSDRPIQVGNGHPSQEESAEAKLAEFKRLAADRNTHPDTVQRAWEEFIEAVERQKVTKAREPAR